MGEWSEQEPEIFRKIFEAGHDVGNHGYSHNDMTKLPGIEGRKEIFQMQKRIEEVSGKKCRFFRFPYGNSNKQLMYFIKRQGMETIGWSVDSEDWTGIDAEAICKKVTESGKLKKGAIVVLHTTHYETVKALDMLIPVLKEKGYQLVKISDLLHIK